jgi:hypothetical protein
MRVYICVRVCACMHVRVCVFMCVHCTVPDSREGGGYNNVSRKRHLCALGSGYPWHRPPNPPRCNRYCSQRVYHQYTTRLFSVPMVEGSNFSNDPNPGDLVWICTKQKECARFCSHSFIHTKQRMAAAMEGVQDTRGHDIHPDVWEGRHAVHRGYVRQHS